MTNLKRLYWVLNKGGLFVILIFILYGCGREKKVGKYVAKVGKEYLTEAGLNNYATSKKYKNQYRGEIIRNWVENEVLYQEATNRGIQNQDEYKILLSRTTKELAIALLKKQILEEYKNSYSIHDLEQYYEKYKDDFKLPEDAYKLNLITFSNEDAAIKFRTLLIESDWDRILSAYRNDPSIIEIKTRKFFYSHDIYPVNILRNIEGMLPLEVSLVIQTEPSQFTIVQLVEKYPKNSLPSFESIKDIVEQRYNAVKQKEYLEKYISNLISNYNSEIEWYTE